VYIHREKRNVFFITVIDTCTTKVLGHILKPSIKEHNVVLLLDSVLQEYQVLSLRFRNDNGSLFIAHLVREYLKENDVVQVFTYVATPKENVHIAVLQRILKQKVINRYWFDRAVPVPTIMQSGNLQIITTFKKVNRCMDLIK
jgi:transposase InsO family protein